MLGPEPELPRWAEDAGITAPEEGETFESYCRRLGFDAGYLLEDLVERNKVLANRRLACELQRLHPHVFRRYWRARYRASHSERV